MVGWLCFTSHGQRGHLETAPPFTVPCEGCEARFLHRSYWELNPRLLHGSPLYFHCAMSALNYKNEINASKIEINASSPWFQKRNYEFENPFAKDTP